MLPVRPSLINRDPLYFKECGPSSRCCLCCMSHTWPGFPVNEVYVFLWWMHSGLLREAGKGLRSTTSSLYCNYRTQIIGSIKVSWYGNAWHAHLHDCPPLHIRVSSWCVGECVWQKAWSGGREMSNGELARCWASVSGMCRFTKWIFKDFNEHDKLVPIRSELWILNTLDLISSCSSLQPLSFLMGVWQKIESRIMFWY